MTPDPEDPRIVEALLLLQDIVDLMERAEVVIHTFDELEVRPVEDDA